METDRKNAEVTARELEATRSELKLRTEALDQLRLESSSREEEVKMLRKSHDLSVQLTESLRREETEKIQLNARLEQVSDALAASREALSKQQAGLTTVDMEYQRAVREAHELKSKASAVEDVSRENERLKAKVETFKLDMQQLTHRLSDQARDLTEAQAALRDKESQLLALQQSHSALQLQRSEGERARDEVTSSWKIEASRASAAEASVLELRAMAESLRKELGEERQLRQQAERTASEGNSAVRGIKEEVGRACSLSMEAMKKWDKILAQAVDGNYFDSIVSHHGIVYFVLRLCSYYRTSFTQDAFRTLSARPATWQQHSWNVL